MLSPEKLPSDFESHIDLYLNAFHSGLDSANNQLKQVPPLNLVVVTTFVILLYWFSEGFRYRFKVFRRNLYTNTVISLFKLVLKTPCAKSYQRKKELQLKI
jgi:ABC-type multidrug transport system permease subunit